MTGGHRGAGGGGGRGSFSRSGEKIKFENDFDINTANEEFAHILEELKVCIEDFIV